MNKQETKIIVIATTFTLFTLEGLSHYSIGCNKDLPPDQRKLIHIPRGYDMIKLVSIVAAFSILNGLVVGALTKNT